MTEVKEYNITVYSEGLIYSSVCTNLPKHKIPEHMGEHSPTGISSSWAVSKDKYFTDGVTENGAPCPDTEGNRHWLVSC